MQTIEVSEQTGKIIGKLAEESGKPLDAALREAVYRYLEELEDARIAHQRAQDPGKTYGLQEIGSEFGLDD